MNHTIKAINIALVIIISSLTAFAQVTTSGLTGHITDESMEPLAGAAIVAVHIPSGTQYTAVANAEGRYVINGMRSGGPYKVVISYIGMADAEYADVALRLGEPYEINAVMKVSNELDAVFVISESSFNAGKTGTGASFGRGSVENTPSIDRSIYDIVQYTPQATLNKNGGISFAGTNNRYNSFQIDGAVANDAFGLSATGTNGGQTGTNPITLDAIDEIQVVVAPFDVRQSGFTGGAVNAVTKSGTNTVKGSFYSYLNNQDFIGSTPGKLTEGQTREKYGTQLSQTYGFTVGAPVIKDRLFIFASAEYKRNSTPNVYTPANGSYDGITLLEDVWYNGKNLGNIFNSAIADAMVEYYEANYGITGTGETYTPHQVTDRSINALARIDWNIRDNHKFMFRYQFVDAYADRYSAGATQYMFNNSSYKQYNRTHTLVAELNSRVSDEVSNEFRATAVFVRDDRTVPYAGANIFITDAFRVTLGTDYSSGANAVHSDVYTISDNVSIFKGNHNITVGTHNELMRFYNVFLEGAYGSYGFSSINDFFQNEINAYGYFYSDPALTGGNTRWGGTAWTAQFGLYAQDEWKPNTRFTLTYGLRMDMPVLLNKPTANPDFNASQIAKTHDQYVGTTPKASVLFSPRVGFRWYADKERKALIRGGAGLFTGRVPFVWIVNAYNNTGMESKSIYLTGNETIGLPLTSNPYKDIVESGKYPVLGSSNINTLSRNFKYPQTFRVNLGYEQVFGTGWKFTFDALYSKGINNVFFENMALVDNGTKTFAVSPAAADVGNTAPYYSTDKTYDTVIALKNTNKGYSYSLSGQIEKHFGFGLDLMAAYTFGHSYSVNDGTSSVALSNWRYNYAVDSNSPELSHSLFDRPHKVTAAATYTSPAYARGRLRTSVTLTYNGLSGQRYSYSLSEGNGLNFNGDGTYGNSLMYIPTAEEVSLMNWASPEDAVRFENYVKGDKYLSRHRGEWSTRYGAITEFENHFDLHIAQDFYYDRASGRKIQITVDFLNIGNMFNREWGLYGDGEFYARQILHITALKKDTDGNMTPTYQFMDPVDFALNDFYSRWRCQIGLRLTF